MAESTKRILLVEDDSDIRSAMTELLEDASYQVAAADNGQAALGCLEKDTNFDLILLDLMMPIMDGFEFRARQLADPRTSGIPVMIMSADGHVPEKMKRAAVSEYAKKPIDMMPFLDSVARILQAAH
jgi:CheY-like chemotaxis protein